MKVSQVLNPANQMSRKQLFIFYGALPLGFGAFLTAFGSQLIANLSFFQGLAVLISLSICVWWGTDLCCRIAAALMHKRKLGAWLIVLSGFLIAIIPIGILITTIAEHFSTLFPGKELITTHRPVRPSLEYLLNFTRYSLPWLGIWFGVVASWEGYYGVNLYGRPLLASRTVLQHYPAYEYDANEPISESSPMDSKSADIAHPQETHPPKFLEDSRLGPDAIVHAIQASEHYIRIWADIGNDIIRYRFSSAVKEMHSETGMQVHRSWWVELSSVARTQRTSRSINLILENDLKVPVSLAHKAQVSSAISKIEAKTGAEEPMGKKNPPVSMRPGDHK